MWQNLFKSNVFNSQSFFFDSQTILLFQFRVWMLIALLIIHLYLCACRSSVFSMQCTAWIHELTEMMKLVVCILTQYWISKSYFSNSVRLGRQTADIEHNPNGRCVLCLFFVISASILLHFNFSIFFTVWGSHFG